MPQRAIFYLEGPSSGVDLLIKSVVITCTSPKGAEVILSCSFVHIFSINFVSVRFCLLFWIYMFERVRVQHVLLLETTISSKILDLRMA